MTSSIYVCNVFMANRHVWSAANLKRPTRTQAFKHEMEGACHCFACFVWMVAEALATAPSTLRNTTRMEPISEEEVESPASLRLTLGRAKRSSTSPPEYA